MCAATGAMLGWHDAHVDHSGPWPMVRIDEYIDWANTKGYDRGYLIVAPALPVLLGLAALYWFLVSPNAKA